MQEKRNKLAVDTTAPAEQSRKRPSPPKADGDAGNVIVAKPVEKKHMVKDLDAGKKQGWQEECNR